MPDSASTPPQHPTMRMPVFGGASSPLVDEHTLATMPDARVEAVLAAARRAGDEVTTARIYRFWVAGEWAAVRRAVRAKVPCSDVDDVTGEVVKSLLTARFDGCHRGEFVNFVRRVTARRIADHVDRLARRREVLTAFGAVDADDEAPAWEPRVEGWEGAVDRLDAYATAWARRSPLHQEVLALSYFGGLSAKEIADRLDGMSAANVHQVVSRYRRDVA